VGLQVRLPWLQMRLPVRLQTLLGLWRLWRLRRLWRLLPLLVTLPLDRRAYPPEQLARCTALKAKRKAMPAMLIGKNRAPNLSQGSGRDQSREWSAIAAAVAQPTNTLASSRKTFALLLR